MKKGLGVLLSVCLLVLGSCTSRIPEEGEASSIVYEQSKNDTTYGSFADTFLIAGFAQKTPEALADEFRHVIYYNESMMEGVVNTPASLLINTLNESVLLSYDKQSGVFADACRDTLCDHESCLLGTSGNRVYCGADGLFVLASKDDETVLYHTDFTASDAKKLYTCKNTLSYVVQEGEYVYFLEEALDEQTNETISRIMRMKATGSDAEILLEQPGLYYYMPMGGNILYLDPNDGFVLYDTQANETSAFGSAELLPIALYGNDFYYKQNGALYRASDYGTRDAKLLAEDIQINELLFDGESIYFHDGKTVYRTDMVFAEIQEIYTAETDERISNVIVDDHMLFYHYTVRKGSSRKHHFVFVDLQTNNVLEVVNE